jgi:lipoprotein-releasing system permease protein
MIARVAKLVDARDLKSLGIILPCRFDSGPGHHLVSGVTNEKLNKQYKKLKNKKFGIIITQSYAAKLDANINDDVLLVTPVLRSTITGLRPEMHKFNIVDIIPNTKFIPQQIVRLEDMQKILSVGKRVSNINIRLKDLDDGPSLAKNLRNDNSFFYSVSSWADRYSQLFKALSLQKTMMFLILMLIIVIAAFNMLSSMVMLVTDKQNSIAVLRTLGLRKYQVIFIFILQGTILGLIGMALGTALGITISNNVTPIVHGIESILGYKLVDKSVYMLDYLPVKISYMDVIIINITALTLSILATIYPSIKAATISPGKVLKGVL